MRMPTIYEKYLWRMRDYYRIKGLEQPSWIDAATRYYSMLFYAGRELHEQCSRTNIPKETIEWLSSLDHSLVSDDLPLELREGARECVAVLSEMYHTLIEGKDRYFINQWTLSREGRKKMREYLNILPTVRNIMPPKTEFTNVPDHLIFSNRINWVNAEYKLFVAVAGSRICIKNGDPDSCHEEYIDFTSPFLDKIIPMIQWESVNPFLGEKRINGDLDDSNYQGFSKVQIEINRYSYELNLQPAPEGNPFMEILKLVWEEYEAVLREKDLVLPWFKVLGWA